MLTCRRFERYNRGFYLWLSMDSLDLSNISVYTDHQSYAMNDAVIRWMLRFLHFKFKVSYFKFNVLHYKFNVFFIANSINQKFIVLNFIHYYDNDNSNIFL